MTGPFPVPADPAFDPAGRFGIDAFDLALIWAFETKASHIMVVSGEPLWVHAAGRWTKTGGRRFSHAEAEGILLDTCGVNGVAEIRSGSPKEFSYTVKSRGSYRSLPFRISAAGCHSVGGFGFTLNISPPPRLAVDWALLGVEPEITASLRPAAGLNLFAGADGSGRSTLMSSAIRHICEDPGRHENVIEILDPIRHCYDGLDFPHSFVSQSEIGTHISPHCGSDAWSRGLENALRRCPSIIAIGECRNGIGRCIDAAIAGHLVMAGMAAADVPGVIRRVLKMFEPEELRTGAFDLLEALNMIVVQRLVGRVGGGLAAVREFAVFDSRARDSLSRIEPALWPAKIRGMLDAGCHGNAAITGRSMAASAAAMCDAGTIAAGTAGWIAARAGAGSAPPPPEDPSAAGGAG